MPRGLGGYFEATRHPWMCVLFILPLVIIYEVGLLWLGPISPEYLRNGADVWLREGLTHIGVSPFYGAPAILLGILIIWSVWRRGDRPDDLIGVWVGMIAESVLFSLALYGLCQAMLPCLEAVGGWFVQWRGPGAAPSMLLPEPALEQIVSYVGAGIYEETLFRLLLFSGLMHLLSYADFSNVLAVTLAAASSALLFAGAHHLGPYGEPFHLYVFLFRTLAGLYFAVIYQLRGFGVAVGAHAGYDVLVGLLIRPSH
jgi:hypothetical protein